MSKTSISKADFAPLTEFQRIDAADGRVEAKISVRDCNGIIPNAEHADADGDGQVTLKEFINHTYDPKQVRQLANRFGKFDNYTLLNKQFSKAATTRGDWAQWLPLSREEVENLQNEMRSNGVDPAVVQKALRQLLEERGGRGDSALVWLAVHLARNTAKPERIAEDLAVIYGAVGNVAMAESLLAGMAQFIDVHSAEVHLDGVAAAVRRLQSARIGALQPLLQRLGESDTGLQRFGALMAAHDALFPQGDDDTLQAVFGHDVCYNGVTGKLMAQWIASPAQRKDLLKRLGPEDFAELVQFVEHSKPELDRGITIDAVLQVVAQLHHRGITRVGRLSLAAADAILYPDRAKPQTLFVLARTDHNGAIYRTGDHTRFAVEQGRGLQVIELNDDSASALEHIPDSSLQEVVIHGHGNKDKILFGSDKNRDEDTLDKSDPHWEILIRKLRPGGRIVLLSCSTGGTLDSGNILDYLYGLATKDGETMHSKGISIVAPTEPVAGGLAVEAGTGLLVPVYRTADGSYSPNERRP